MLSLVKSIVKPGFEGRAASAWTEACAELGLELRTKAGTAHGVVEGYSVTASLLTLDSGVHTKYTVELDAPHAPEFRLTGSAQSNEDGARALVFDDLVNITTDEQVAMTGFLTAERRTLIADTVCRFQSTVVTSSQVAVARGWVESDPREIVRSFHHLVSLADALSPCWAEVALDEGSVLDDLFDPSRNLRQVSERFEQLYRAGEVTWTGEVLQVGEVEKFGRRAVILVGGVQASANLGTMWGGRVVAITLLDPALHVDKGSVVTFSGGLRNLDAAKRMFRIEDSANWKLKAPLLASA